MSELTEYFFSLEGTVKQRIQGLVIFRLCKALVN